MEPATLSEINVDVHGFTSDDVIANRKAQRESIEQLRTSPNSRHREIYSGFREMEMLGAQYGIDATYDEQLDEDDLY